MFGQSGILWTPMWSGREGDYFSAPAAPFAVGLAKGWVGCFTEDPFDIEEFEEVPDFAEGDLGEVHEGLFLLGATSGTGKAKCAGS